MLRTRNEIGGTRPSSVPAPWSHVAVPRCLFPSRDELYHEPGAFARSTLGPRAPAVQRDELRHDREADAAAGNRRAHRALEALIGLPDALAMLGCDSRALIVDDDAGVRS